MCVCRVCGEGSVERGECRCVETGVCGDGSVYEWRERGVCMVSG